MDYWAKALRLGDDINEWLDCNDEPLEPAEVMEMALRVGTSVVYALADISQALTNIETYLNIIANKKAA